MTPAPTPITVGPKTLPDGESRFTRRTKAFAQSDRYLQEEKRIFPHRKTTPNASSNPPLQSLFLLLPFELRMMIYMLVLCGHHIQLYSKIPRIFSNLPRVLSRQALSSKLCNEPGDPHFITDFARNPDRTKHTAMNLSLLRVCQQIYLEASLLHYKESRFRLDAALLPRFLHFRSPWQLESLRFLALTVKIETEKHSQKFEETCETIWRSLPGLKDIRLVVEVVLPLALTASVETPWVKGLLVFARCPRNPAKQLITSVHLSASVPADGRGLTSQQWHTQQLQVLALGGYLPQMIQERARAIYRGPNLDQ